MGAMRAGEHPQNKARVKGWSAWCLDPGFLMDQSSRLFPPLFSDSLLHSSRKFRLHDLISRHSDRLAVEKLWMLQSIGMAFVGAKDVSRLSRLAVVGTGAVPPLPALCCAVTCEPCEREQPLQLAVQWVAAGRRSSKSGYLSIVHQVRGEVPACRDTWVRREKEMKRRGTHQDWYWAQQDRADWQQERAMKGVNPQKSGQQRTLPVDPDAGTKTLPATRQAISKNLAANICLLLTTLLFFTTDGQKEQ